MGHGCAWTEYLAVNLSRKAGAKVPLLSAHNVKYVLVLVNCYSNQLKKIVGEKNVSAWL